MASVDVAPSQLAGADAVRAGCPGSNGSTMATNALAEDPAAAGVLPEACLAEVAGAELAEPAAVLLLDPELLQAASRPARAVSPAVQASCLTRPGFRPRSTRSTRPMTFRLCRGRPL